jgi:beta-lactamase superfamily II metal-dependent hydrolase
VRRYSSRASMCLLAVLIFYSFHPTSPVFADGTCGSGSWTPGNLEIHHINIGQGDAALIVGPTGKSLLFDAGESYWNSHLDALTIGSYVEGVLGCKSLDYVVVSHFHVDHVGYIGYGGLWHLVETQGFTVGTTLVRDYHNYLGDISGTFTNWKIYLEGAGQAKLHPVTAVQGTGQVDLGPGVTIDILTVDGNGAILAGDFHGDASPPSENDYSIGALISFGDFDEWIGGDVDGEYHASGFGYSYHDIELSVAPKVGDVDVYKVNHHGSAHSSSATFMNQLDPEVSIITVGNGNTYGLPTQSTMDRLLATSTVYMTERGDTNTNIGPALVAGNIVIKTSDGSSYTVNDAPFTATEPARTDADGDGYFVEADPDDSLSAEIPAANGGCDSDYQTCAEACQVTSGQILINEVLPSPSSGTEWVELYNATTSTKNIGYCVIDDIVAGSAAYQIPASTLIPAHGFWTLDRTSYFNNAGDDVRFLMEDGVTVLDSHTYGNTASNLSWYRFPDGGTWATSATASTTKGQSNTLSFHPVVLSIIRADTNPIDLASVGFVVTFSKAVTGVNTSAPFSDFVLTKSGITGGSILSVTGSGDTYTVTVNTGTGNGTLRLDIVDDDTILDDSSRPLGGVGRGNGNFSSGESYSIQKITPKPGVPILVSPGSATLVNTLGPVFDWNDSIPAAHHYQLQIAETSTFVTPVVNEINVAASVFSPASNLLPGKLYYWRVKALNVIGEASNWSAERNFKTPLAQPVLAAPANGISVPTDRPNFDWDDIPGASQYILQVSTLNTFGSLLLNVTVNGSNYSPSRDLPQVKPLYWRVAAKTSAVTGLWSSPGNFITGNPPTVPTLSSPAANALLKDYRPIFKWSKVTVPAFTTFDHYQIVVDDDPAFGSSEVDENIYGQTLVQFQPGSDLNSNTKYYWRVRAFNSAGEYSGWSAIRFFRTVILSPQSLTVIPNGLRPRFDWDDATGTVTNYTIQISTSSTFGTFLVNSTTVNSFYDMLKDLPSGKTIYWRVKVNGANGPSGWSTGQYVVP